MLFDEIAYEFFSYGPNIETKMESLNIIQSTNSVPNIKSTQFLAVISSFPIFFAVVGYV